VSHSHINPGTVDNEWRAFGVDTPDQRAGRPPIPGAVWVYLSPDLDMPGGPQTWTLSRCDLEAGAVGSLEQLSGEAFLVALSGTVQLEVAGQAPLSLIGDANPGAYVATGTQHRTTAPAGSASYLLYLLTSETSAIPPSP
jgi:hypothetical protein